MPLLSFPSEEVQSARQPRERVEYTAALSTFSRQVRQFAEEKRLNSDGDDGFIDNARLAAKLLE